jgi:hypothetical protein
MAVVSDDIDGPAQIGRMAASAATVATLRDAIRGGEPYPAGPVSGDGPEAEWGPPDVLAHTAEMLQYWLGEIERVIAGGPDPVPFGRVATDPLRTLTIERDRTLPTGELISRIQASVGRYGARLPQLSPADWQKRGLHPRRGEMTVAAILERFVVSHLEEHAVQLREALAG